MIRWTFRFAVPPAERLNGRDQRKWIREINQVVGPLVDSCRKSSDQIHDYAIDLDSPRLPELVDYLQLLHKKKVARLNLDWNALEETLIDDAQTPVEWFLLCPREGAEQGYAASFSYNRLEDGLACKADHLKPGFHLAGCRDRLGVSERFKALVEAEKLTGVEFFWLKDIGRYRAPQWYLPHALALWAGESITPGSIPKSRIVSE